MRRRPVSRHCTLASVGSIRKWRRELRAGVEKIVKKVGALDDPRIRLGGKPLFFSSRDLNSETVHLGS